LIFIDAPPVAILTLSYERLPSVDDLPSLVKVAETSDTREESITALWITCGRAWLLSRTR